MTLPYVLFGVMKAVAIYVIFTTIVTGKNKYTKDGAIDVIDNNTAGVSRNECTRDGAIDVFINTALFHYQG